MRVSAGNSRGVIKGLGLMLAVLSGAPLQAATSVLIWPIDPVLEADQKASALWL
ncbi:hypothetical protein D3C84_1313420 [compost metagenome]